METAPTSSGAPARGDRPDADEAIADHGERRADSTRQRLIAAASHQFARRSYSMVSLDDILSEAEVTKGAMYFHFPSKHALASAIIEDLTELSRSTISDLLARHLSGLESVIDLVYLRAVQDLQNEVARAGVRLIETLENTTAQPVNTMWELWIAFVAKLIRQAVGEGDVRPDSNPEVVAKMLVALWVGIRRISDPDQPQYHLDNLREALQQALPSFTNADRNDYFVHFIERRHTLAARLVSGDAN